MRALTPFIHVNTVMFGRRTNRVVDLFCLIDNLSTTARELSSHFRNDAKIVLTI